MKKLAISASLMCADILSLEKSLRELEGAVDFIHCDIMDWHFVPNLMLSPELLIKTRSACSLPYDFHLMTERPEELIPRLGLREGDVVTVHAESTRHLQRAVSIVRDFGAMPGVAINPATPLESIGEVLPDVGLVLVMTVNPGYAGQTLVPQTLDKLCRTRKMLDSRGFGDVSIQADGNCSFANIPKMYKAGADNLVCGSSSLFSGDMSIEAAAEKIRSSVKITPDE